MRRLELLHCVNMDAPRFKLLRQRGQLPINTEPDEGRSARANYSLAEAFEIALFCEFIGEGEKAELAIDDVLPERIAPAIPPSAAFSLVPNLLRDAQFRAQIHHPLDRPLSAPDIWMGAAVGRELYTPNGNELESEELTITQRFVGEPSQIADFLGDSLSDAVPFGRLVLANASAVARTVRKRASSEGIPEGDDFQPVWEIG